MKYIDAEKLIAEIERRRDKAKEKYFESTYSMGRCDALAEFRSYIVSLQQEQTDLPSGEDVMTMCNQILIDWVKEGKTKKEKEQRAQAHIRFFELYDDYLFQEQPEVDLEKLVNEEFASHSRTTEYGLEVTYNRAELYQLIKRIALVFNARK